MVNISTYTYNISIRKNEKINSTGISYFNKFNDFFFHNFFIPMYTICYDWYIIQVVSIYKIDINHREDQPNKRSNWGRPFKANSLGFGYLSSQTYFGQQSSNGYANYPILRMKDRESLVEYGSPTIKGVPSQCMCNIPLHNRHAHQKHNIPLPTFCRNTWVCSQIHEFCSVTSVPSSFGIIHFLGLWISSISLNRPCFGPSVSLFQNLPLKIEKGYVYNIF